MQRRPVRSAICRRGTNEDVVDRIFCVLDLDFEETTFERGRVPKFKFAFASWAPGILPDQLFVGESRVRITINHPHEAVRRRIVDVPVKFLDVLTMIALGPGHAEETLLQNRIAPIPKCKGKAKTLLEI